MSFSSETYRVLIASPSDLPEERQAATDAINEWNAEHAAAEGVVLLPVKWKLMPCRNPDGNNLLIFRPDYSRAGEEGRPSHRAQIWPEESWVG